VVPDHFWLEVTNVLMTRYGWDPRTVVEALQALDELGVETAPIDRPLVLLGIDLMAAHGLTAYDAAYLALAISDDAELVTLDAELGLASGDRARLRARRTNEARARYGSGAAEVRWAADGRYLAELRRKVLSA
jgi:predicted nucleic acid-binding protein